MPTDQTIDYLELPADDFQSIQSFYTNAFNWEFTDYGPEYCAFADHKMAGGFYKSPLKSRTDSGAVLIVLYAKNLEATYDKVKSNGGNINKEIFSFPGGRRFHFLDPHGNELAVWSDS